MRGHHNSVEAKVNVVRALLALRLAIASNTDGTIAGLLIDRTEYRRFLITLLGQRRPAPRFGRREAVAKLR
jgi:hypothetical protein